jgi:hypothetical protein
MTDLTYLGQPDIPPGLTIAEYRRSRAARPRPWWRRVLGAGA